MPIRKRHVPAPSRRAAKRALLRSPACALIAGLLLLASRPAIAQAETAYVWANDPTAASYPPNSDYAYNPTGGPIEVVRGSTGVYKVRFVGMSLHGGNVQVTAYGAGTSHYCKVASWGGDAIKVLCFDGAGNPADAQFTALFSRTAGGWPAYAWANDPTAAGYAPNPAYVSSPYGGRVEVAHNATGRYSIRFNGTAAGPYLGVVHVTAYGDDNRRCEVTGWGSGWGGGTLTVGVSCFKPPGTPADARFTVLLSSAGGASGPAYAWADEPTSARYVPRLAHNPAGVAVEIERRPTGTYRVRFPGLNLNAGNVQVTAYGDDDRRCNVAFWSGDTIHVDCFDRAGAPADARYTVLFMDQNPGLQTPPSLGPVVVIPEGGYILGDPNDGPYTLVPWNGGPPIPVPPWDPRAWAELRSFSPQRLTAEIDDLGKRIEILEKRLRVVDGHPSEKE